MQKADLTLTAFPSSHFLVPSAQCPPLLPLLQIGKTRNPNLDFPPEEGRKMDSNEDPAKNYSLRGRIMFSAIVVLFTIVFLLFCVHVYSRWFLLRRSRRNNYLWNQRNQLLFAENVQTVPTAVCGLEESVLKNLPIIVFSEKTKSIECAVCLCEFEENEKLRLLPSCNHRFHIDCIDMWFHSHSNCPLCRAPVKIPVQLEHQKEADQCDSCRQFTEIEPSASSTSSTSSSSASSSREQLGFLTIEVPRMAGSFRVIEEETVSPYPNSFRSMGRLFSLKTILGKDRRGSATETDLETGEDESRHGTISR